MASAYRRFQESLHGLTEAEAEARAREDWRQYRFSTGLDGSIRGIVRHVATWKHAAAAGLASGTFPAAEGVLPDSLSWAALLEALNEGHARLAAELACHRDEELDRSVTWEGHPMPVHVLLAHMIEHDQYHAGQINLLRQQLGHVLE
jgi:uncharacterized damage-inducible protein DinB